MKEFIARQLESWSLASENYTALESVKQRIIIIDDFPVVLQHNPGRIISTSAHTDAASIKQRPCFLCHDNRPSVQQSIPFKGHHEYEILVNPFPIAPLHLTVASVTHEHQDTLDPHDMEIFVKMYPGLTAFYNGSTAGASAPDHLHFQACNTDSFHNIIDLITANPGQLMKQTDKCRIYSLPFLPMCAVHFISETIEAEQLSWLTLLHSDVNRNSATGMRNIIMWFGPDELLHTLLFPRSAHRPACYFSKDSTHRLVSPGAIDMAGIIILPREEDFDNMTMLELRHIYSEVSLDYTGTRAFRQLMMQ